MINKLLGFAGVVLTLAGCAPASEIYKVVGAPYEQLWVSGGFNGWGFSKMTKVTTTTGYVTTWTFTTDPLTATNRSFKILITSASAATAAWSDPHYGWSGIASNSTGVTDPGDSNIAISSTAVVNGNKALIKVDQGSFDKPTKTQNLDRITVTTAP